MVCLMAVFTNLGDHLMFLKYSLSLKSLIFFNNKRYLRQGENHDDHYFPREIQRIILKDLTIHDRVRLGATNKDWREVLVQKDDTIVPNPTHQLPWLTLPTTSNCMSFYDMNEGKLHKLNLPKQLRGGTCCASSRGWLVIAKPPLSSKFRIYSQKNLDLYLFNPITQDVHKLPSLLSITQHYVSFPEEDIYNWISTFELSSSRINSQCVVAGIFGKYKDVLGFCRPGDKDWITYEYDRSNPFFSFHNLLYWNGTFNTVVVDSTLNAILPIEVSLGDGLMITTLLIPSFVLPSSNEVDDMGDYSHLIGYPSLFYLVESVEGNLLMIRQTMDTLIHPAEIAMFQDHVEDEVNPVLEYLTTRTFEVFNVDMENNCLLKLENIENQVIFIGKETSKCVCSVNNDDNNVDGKGVQRNSIYFLDNSFNSLGILDGFKSFMNREQGVFNLTTGKITRFIPGLYSDCDEKVMCWLTPTIT